MDTSFVAYIDESGDQGFKFGAGSSNWLVLSAVITNKHNDIATVKLVDNVRSNLGRPAKIPLHFRDIKPENERIIYLQEIARADIQAVTVLIYKPALEEAEHLKGQNLYFYAVYHLLEIISHCCASSATSALGGDGSVELIFSACGEKSFYTNMCDYIYAAKINIRECNIDWSIIKLEQLAAYSHGRQRGLQIADAVASGCFFAVETNSKGLTNNQYIRLLKPNFHKLGISCVGYGIKVLPKKTAKVLDTENYFKTDLLL